MAAFRTRYGRLAEIRSLVPPSVPMASFTATASAAMRGQIIHSLSLTNPIFVEKSPDRCNIKYSCIQVKSTESPKIFKSLREELHLKKKTTERTIVFCRTHRQCRELYEYFKAGVEDRDIFAMYHSTAHQPQKDRVLASFAERGGVVRVLFATVAFGMGVDCKELKRIYHYGPPEDIEDYVQETGRAGRGGEESDVVLINYKGCTRYKVSDDMKGYMANKDTCRRSVLLAAFGGDAVNADTNKHRCCDICAKLCECGKEDCNKEVFECVESEKKRLHEFQQCRHVTQEKKDKLLSRLTDLRGSVVAGSSAELLAGCDLSSGIPLSELNSFVDNCDRINSFDMFTTYFQFFGHEQDIWEIFVSECQDHCEIEQFSYSDSLSSECENQCPETLRGVLVYSSESD